MRNNNINDYISLNQRMDPQFTSTHCLMKNLDILNLKKGDVIAYDRYNAIVKILNRANQSGNYPSDAFECYSIPLNVKDYLWFQRYENQLFELDTIVLYSKDTKKKLYKITKYVGCGHNAGTYTIEEIYGKSEYEDVPLKDIKKADTYWFFNSKGSKCIALVEDDKNADEFRKLSKNYYKTRQEIDLAYMQMKGLAQK